MKSTNFNDLPETVKAEVKDFLRAYDEVNVWYENGRYSFGDVLKRCYAPDHRFVGTYRAEEIYTEKERIENYINEFHDFPRDYKGRRDYTLLHNMNEEREVSCVPGSKELTMTTWYGKINEKGDFELTEKRTTVI